MDNGKWTMENADMIDPLANELRSKGSVRFYVRARPNAPETKILECLDDGSVKIAIAAPAEQGKANSVLLKFLAKEFGVNSSQVKIVSGEAARQKLIQIRIH